MTKDQELVSEALSNDIGMNEYQFASLRCARKMPSDIEDLLHAVLGALSECGELATTIKKSYIYNQPIDGENIREEIGDCLWYLALAANTIDTHLSECARLNIEKLKVRYPEGYSDKNAYERKDK